MSVAVGCGALCVGRVGGRKADGEFVGIGDAIAIGVGRRGRGVECGIAADL